MNRRNTFKRTIPASLLWFATVLALVSFLLVPGCENPTSSSDDEENIEPFELDGLYAGYWEVTESTIGSVVGERITVFTLEVAGSDASMRIVAPIRIRRNCR